MSGSIHTTYKDIRGLTRKEIVDQMKDPDSDLAKLAKKLLIKKKVFRTRKTKK